MKNRQTNIRAKNQADVYLSDIPSRYKEVSDVKTIISIIRDFAEQTFIVTNGLISVIQLGRKECSRQSISPK
ncbi:MAG: hypothetical protein M3530_02740 [Thermoproteota archaeon]|nr:hypothetical protein [Thermoproteota archaeon]